MIWAKTCLELSGLLINGVLDLKTKQISLWVTTIYGAVGILWQIYFGTMTWEFAFSLVPGILCLLAAWATKERVGYGDGYLLIATGCYLGWEDMLLLCMMAVISAGIWALILCVLFHKGKDYEIPFVPFMLIGYMAGRWLA